MGLPNQIVDKHMEALFETARAATLREQIKGCAPDEREAMIVEAMCEALKAMA
jgi:hypothetical protein